MIIMGICMTAEEFKKLLFDSPDEMLPNGTDAQTALEIIAQHFLSEPLILNYPGSIEQWNSEVVYEILRRYQSGRVRIIPKAQRRLDNGYE